MNKRSISGYLEQDEGGGVHISFTEETSWIDRWNIHLQFSDYWTTSGVERLFTYTVLISVLQIIGQ